MIRTAIDVRYEYAEFLPHGSPQGLGVCQRVHALRAPRRLERVPELFRAAELVVYALELQPRAPQVDVGIRSHMVGEGGTRLPLPRALLS